MKYPLFEHLIDDYPTALEQHYERILKKIVELWNEPEIDDYFTTLTIDNRGGEEDLKMMFSTISNGFASFENLSACASRETSLSRFANWKDEVLNSG
jgi:hypothetical protein